jgi:hypothetical protein
LEGEFVIPETEFALAVAGEEGAFGVVGEAGDFCCVFYFLGDNLI